MIIVNLLVGASIAYSARIQIRTLQRPVFQSRYFTGLVMLELIILMPVGIYFYTFFPDWSWMYLVDSLSIPPGLGAMALVAYPVAGLLGYLVGYFSARGNSDWVTLMFLVFVGAGLVGMFVVADEQLLWLGTFEQFRRNTGLKPLADTSLMPSMILAWSGAVICWAYLFYRFHHEGRLSLRLR
jgi:hypothetical protein